MILVIPVQEHGMSSHVLKSASDTFRSVLLFFSYPRFLSQSQIVSPLLLLSGGSFFPLNLLAVSFHASITLLVFSRICARAHAVSQPACSVPFGGCGLS